MSGIALLVEDPKWRTHRGLAARLNTAAEAAAAAVRLKGDFTILLASDRKLHALNRDFRGKDKPTNVLSFPSGDTVGPRGALLLGDIVIAYGTVAREAAAQGKTIRDHLLHLVVHGVLHLLGHDHQRSAEAARMESIETELLAGLGIADPYVLERKRA
jgi:probable rRNA maturation factor